MAGEPLVENYPLVVGGVDDYPVKVGSMLLTMVDPVRGFEREYNRWYERDHFYGGCMIGPWLYAGSRWVAPRELKDLRWPGDGNVAQPVDAGSYVAITGSKRASISRHDGHHAGFDLYANGRGFPKRDHVHTILSITSAGCTAMPIPFCRLALVTNTTASRCVARTPNPVTHVRCTAARFDAHAQALAGSTSRSRRQGRPPR